MNIKEIISVSLILFSVIDIIGSIPIILDLKHKGAVIEPLKSSVVSLVIMVLFLLLGEFILSLFGVDVKSFAVAGSIVLFFLGLEMILGIKLFRDETKKKSNVIVPLAFPLIAGAGTMTTIISLKSRFDTTTIGVAIVLNIIFVYIVLLSTDTIKKIVGDSGIQILRKLFGIILLAIAIKLFRDNFHLVIAPMREIPQ
jgi:multiple antibiotic resistance protein